MRGKNSMLSVPCREFADAPAREQRATHRDGAMRLDQNPSDGNQSLKTLEEKWAEFTNDIFLALRKEEIKIRREELGNHDEGSSRPCAPQGPSKNGGNRDG